MANSTSVEFWDVGAASPAPLKLTVGEISFHLGIDWLPSLPPPFRSSIFGWPPLLIDALPADATGAELLALNLLAGRSERQWKTVLSWMLGVAGARHVMERERYRWVAPTSAFYPDAIQKVDLSNWQPAFPRSVVQTFSRPNSSVLLRPDYLALRSMRTGQPGSFDWAVVEAKGTASALTNRSKCPPEWLDQVRNIVVKVRNQPLTIPRYLVVATRVNPNAFRPKSRRIQVRAWNSQSAADQQSLFTAAAVEIVAAHLFGLFVGLRQPDYARAIARSTQARLVSAERHLNDDERQVLNRGAEFAEESLTRRARRPIATNPRQVDAEVDIETERGILGVDLSTPLMNLARQLCGAVTVEAANEAVRFGDAQLDTWETSRRATARPTGEIVMPFGVELRVPAEFEPRR